jgi:peptidoglycan/xylan/chitin deacetylase (PgdA/CDA1 family)
VWRRLLPTGAVKKWLRLVRRDIFPYLPRWVDKASAQADFQLARRVRRYQDPTMHPKHGLERGAVTISLDFELAWAWRYSKRESTRCIEKGSWERLQVPIILRELENYGVAATWATVGHLFLSACNRGPDGLAHHLMPRLKPFETFNWDFTSGDWFQHDPCSNVKQDPAWYGPDLVEKILSSSVGHEIGCHSFSHAGFGPYCPPQVAAAELDACTEAMAPYGLRPTTWVFPGSDEGNFEVLARKGVRVVRAFPRKSANLTLPIRRKDGVWAVHVSSAIDRGANWSPAQRLTRLKEFVDAAASSGLAAHVWLHPSLSQSDMRQIFIPFLRYCAEQREKGLIDVYTMEQLVSATENARRGERP